MLCDTWSMRLTAIITLDNKLIFIFFTRTIVGNPSRIFLRLNHVFSFYQAGGGRLKFEEKLHLHYITERLYIT